MSDLSCAGVEGADERERSSPLLLFGVDGTALFGVVGIEFLGVDGTELLGVE